MLPSLFRCVAPILAALALLELGATQVVAAPMYTVTDLSQTPGLPAGAQVNSAMGINTSGQVVGTWYAGSTSGSYLYGQGQMTDTTASGASGYGINDSGQMTIGSERAINNSGQATYSNAINGNGITVDGTTVPILNGTTGVMHPIIDQNGKITDLGLLPGATSAAAAGINDKGEVVGGGESHPFLFDGYRLLDLGTFGGTSGEARGINNKSQIVGDADLAGRDANGYMTHAFLYQDGKLLDLNNVISKDLGWDLIRASAINDSGMIVGLGDHNGKVDAFLLTPNAVPEPNTIVLFGLIAGIVGYRLSWSRVTKL
jgi:probable HAF family extracellular repeat protein